VAWDVGANYAIHTILMARLVGTAGRVYSFEPHPRICKACQENVDLNGFKNVRVLGLALSDRQCQMPFVCGQHDGAGHVATAGEGSSFSVQCEAGDDLIANGSALPPQLIKIDIEGHAAAALIGAERTFREHQPALLVDLHNPDEDAAVGHFLQSQGYLAVRQDSLEKIRRLDAGWPVPDGIYGSVLALHPEKARRLKWLLV
jgi:FkbM family methyltransferase